MIRTTGCVALLVTAIAVLSAALPLATGLGVLEVRGADPPGDDWPMFRGDARLSGVARSTLPERPVVLWQYEAGQPVAATAAIVGDTVYVGDLGGVLHAVRLADGTERWKYQADNLGIQGAPCVAEGRVFFGDVDGTFHAVDAATGKKLWTFEAQGEILSSANYVDGRVVFGSSDQNIYCLDREGKLLWHFATEGMVQSTPAVADGRVFVSGCDENLRLIDLKSGKETGHVKMASPTAASPVVTDQFAFVGTYANRVQGIDWKQNKVLWDYDPTEGDFPFMSSAAMSKGLLVVGGQDRKVHAIDPATGKARWTFNTRRRVDSSPVIVGSRAFVGSDDGNLYALDLATGNETWRFTVGAAITASHAVARGRLVIGSHDGFVYCFGQK
jgi:outer membrane protein assembly factor BamB